MNSNLLQYLSQHVFLILALSVIIMTIGFMVLIKKRPVFLVMLFLLPVFGVVNLFCSAGWNAKYVYENGVEGDAVVTSIEPTNNYMNNVQVFKYHCTIKTATGKQVKAVFENNLDLLYPQDEPGALPAVGEIFKVKYIPTDEDNFVILTNKDPKQKCMKLLENITAAQALYQLDKTNPENKRAYKTEINIFLKEPCDTNVQKAFTLLLEQLN
jgi:hypothetical protein